jgi:NAD(P)-dependent dehydrogenase (short-subunit alcohol dehydrogenase family)
MSSSNRTAVVTGSTGGIGAAVTERLAAEGWNLVLVNRSEEKATAQQQALLSAHPGVSVDLELADLMDAVSVTAAAAAIVERHPSIDRLFNIAGVLTAERRLSEQGYESHFAVNVLAPYLLMTGLRPALRRERGATPSVVVNMSSGVVHRAKSLDPEAMPRQTSIGGGLNGAYADSKLALDALGLALADELLADGILVRSADPGATSTSMIEAGDGVPRIVRLLRPLLFRAPETRVDGILTAADPAAFDGRAGVFAAQGKEKQHGRPARDPAVQERLLGVLAAAA